MPSLDVAIIVESSVASDKKAGKIWETTSEFVGTFIKRISAKTANVNTGIVAFNGNQQYPLLKMALNTGGLEIKNLLLRQQSASSSVNIVKSLEFAYNRFLTEEYSSMSNRKVLVAVTESRITDVQFADIIRNYPDERVLFLNVVMKYNRQDVGLSDFGIEESRKSVYSLSELSELVRRINQEHAELMVDGKNTDNNSYC